MEALFSEYLCTAVFANAQLKKLTIYHDYIFPIKAVVNLIAAIIIVIAVFSFLEKTCQVLNDGFDW